jgi:four helix bundle protein
MFDFEKLEVYKKAKAFHAAIITSVLNSEKIDSVTKNQLRRAALSVPLNIAEGSSRFSKADRKNFCVISRGSVFECVAILEILKDQGQLSAEKFNTLYCTAEEMSKMLFSMIRNLESQSAKCLLHL